MNLLYKKLENFWYKKRKKEIPSGPYYTVGRTWTNKHFFFFCLMKSIDNLYGQLNSEQHVTSNTWCPMAQHVLLNLESRENNTSVLLSTLTLRLNINEMGAKCLRSLYKCDGIGLLPWVNLIKWKEHVTYMANWTILCIVQHVTGKFAVHLVLENILPYSAN